MNKIFHYTQSPDGSHKIIHVLWFRIKISSNKKNKPQVYIYDENQEKKINSYKYLPKNINIKGGNETDIVKIHKNLIAKSINITFAKETQNNICIFEDSEDSTGLDVSIYFLEGEKNELRIGKRTGMNGTKIWLGNGSKCYIGNNCRFSYEVIIRTTDGHTIIDRNSKKIINEQKHPCIIEDSCWVGLRTIINKNVQLPHDTIIGAGSVVTKKFEEPYTILAGNPAKVIKRNVKHYKETIYDYKKGSI